MRGQQEARRQYEQRQEQERQDRWRQENEDALRGQQEALEKGRQRREREAERERADESAQRQHDEILQRQQEALRNFERKQYDETVQRQQQSQRNYEERKARFEEARDRLYAERAGILNSQQEIVRQNQIEAREESNNQRKRRRRRRRELRNTEGQGGEPGIRDDRSQRPATGKKPRNKPEGTRSRRDRLRREKEGRDNRGNNTDPPPAAQPAPPRPPKQPDRGGGGAGANPPPPPNPPSAPPPATDKSNRPAGSNIAPDRDTDDGTPTSEALDGGRSRRRDAGGETPRQRKVKLNDPEAEPGPIDPKRLSFSEQLKEQEEIRNRQAKKNNPNT